ncbi:MAG TPA: hypothetical protein VG675_15330 [Bryobacteraceae bacterium]|nr:hypothetical protein [Bryobacteraceae bacterium]
MASGNKSVKQKLRDYLEERQPPTLTETVWRELLALLSPVSESYLRELLRDTGLHFDQPWAGVGQHTFEELEQSLREIGQVYAEAIQEGNRERARYCRRQVIGAKDRAKFIAHNSRTPAGKKAEKEEMAQWMLVWLEDPDVFPAWVEARKRALGGPAPLPDSP